MIPTVLHHLSLHPNDISKESSRIFKEILESDDKYNCIKFFSTIRDGQRDLLMLEKKWGGEPLYDGIDCTSTTVNNMIFICLPHLE